MREDTVTVETDSGIMNVFIARPIEKKRYRPVVLFMDIWGVREELRQIARKIASEGYFAILPNLYYRQGDVAHEFYDDDEKMISLHRLGEERSNIVQGQRQKLSNDMILADTSSLIRYIDQNDEIEPGPIGSIGWCMGGWICLKTGVEFPDRFQAMATLHATKPISDTPDSPHHDVAKLRGGLYSGWAELDHLSPPAMVSEFEQLLSGQQVDYRGVTHAGVEHGYSLPDRDIYAAEAAEQDWDQIFGLYRTYLTG